MLGGCRFLVGVVAVACSAAVAASGVVAVPRAEASPTDTAYFDSVMAKQPVLYFRFGDDGEDVYLKEEVGQAGIWAPANANWMQKDLISFGQPGATPEGNSSVRFSSPSGELTAGASTPIARFRHEVSGALEVWLKPEALPTAGEEANIFNAKGCCWGYTVAGLKVSLSESGTVIVEAGRDIHPAHSPVIRVESSQSIFDGDWHHIAAVYNHDTRELAVVVDGVPTSVFAPSFEGLRWTTNHSAPRLVMAASARGATAQYVGFMDEVAIYARPLDIGEVRENILASGRPAPPAWDDPIVDPVLVGGEMLGPNGALRNQHLAQQCVCDPVDTFTGNLHMPVPSVAVPGRGPGLAVGLGYNSLSAAEDSRVGHGWSSSLDMRIEDRAFGTRKVVVQETGAEVPFTLMSDGDWLPPGRFEATLVPSGDGFLFTRNHFESFRFDGSGRLVEMLDQFGNVTEVHYPSAESTRADWVEDVAGRRLSISWDGDRVASISDPLPVAEGGPRIAEFDYDGNGDLVAYTDLSGGVWSFSYDGSHRMLTMTKPRHQGTDRSIVNHYDAQGRVDWQEDELDRRTTISYENAAVGGTLVTLPGGRQQVFRFQDGLRVESIDGFGSPDAVSSKINFDPDTYAVVSTEDNAGNVTVFADPDGDGNINAVKDPTGRITEFTYDPFDQVVDTTAGKIEGPGGITAPDGTVTTRNEYHPSNGRLEKSTTAVGSADAAVTDFVYGDPSHPEDVTTIIDPRGKSWTFGYDPGSGDVVWSENPEEERTVTTYSAIGWPLTVTSPKGVATPGVPDDYQTTYDYDIENRTTTVTGPTGDKTRTTLDANGNTATVATGITGSNPSGDVTSHGYTHADELETVDAPGPGAKTYRYRPDGLRDRFTNELGAIWAYGYDAAGRLKTETDPNGNATTHGYDAAGRLASVLQPVPGATCSGTKVGCISYSYDHAGRPLGVDYSDATPDLTGIIYDGLGRRTEATVGGVQETWEWNDRSQLVAHADVNGHTTGYEWDPAGNLEELFYPGQSVPVVRGFDDAGRLVSVTDWNGNEATFDYDVDSNWTQSTFSDGSSVVNTDEFGYDAAGRMTSATWLQGGPSGTVLGSETYTRPVDTKGMVDVATPAGAAGSGVRDHDYDARDRLTTTGPESFGYDPAGNLVELPDGRLQVFDPAQQLCSSSPSGAAGTCAHPADDATVFDYDPLGNRITETSEDNEVRTHSYDQANRLVSVTDESGSSPAPLSAMTGRALVGDFDGDGEDDVFFYRPGGSNDDWMWWGTDREQFGQVADSFSVSGTYQTVTGDFNGDGHDDILWYSPTAGDHVWFWFGRYEGGYDSKQFAVEAGFEPISGDFDGDGYADIYWYGPGANPDAMWWGGPTVDEPNVNFGVGFPQVSGTYIPVVGNFNGSGGDEIFWYGPGSTPDSIWYWTSGSRTPISMAKSVNTSGYAPVAGDADGDGRDDIIWNAPGAIDPVWWGTSTLAALGGTTTTGWVSIGADHTPVFGDFDGDGSDDLFLYKPTTTGDTIWWGTTPTTRGDFGTDPDQIGFPSGPTLEASYRYNASGLRAGKTVNGDTEQQFTWSADGGLPLLLAEHQGAETTYLIYGPGGQPIAQIDPDDTSSWYHHDQLGSVRLTTNASDGTQASARAYDAYGTTATASGTQPLLDYAGQYTDPETGYQYLRARYYDPMTGQFLTRDPLVATTEEPYAYGGSSPVNVIDPTGLIGFEIAGYKVGDGCPLGKNPNGSCRGADAVDTAADAGQWVWDHKAEIAGGIGLGVCVLGTPAACIVAGKYALAVGWGHSAEKNLLRAEPDVYGFLFEATVGYAANRIPLHRIGGSLGARAFHSMKGNGPGRSLEAYKVAYSLTHLYGGGGVFGAQMLASYAWDQRNAC